MIEQQREGVALLRSVVAGLPLRLYPARAGFRCARIANPVTIAQHYSSACAMLCFLSTAVCLKRIETFRELRLAAAEEGYRGKHTADAGDSANAIISIPKRVNSQDTSAETGLDLPLEIARLLLIDLVGYSKLLVNEEIELLQELNHILHSFRVAEAIGDA